MLILNALTKTNIKIKAGEKFFFFFREEHEKALIALHKVYDGDEAANLFIFPAMLSHTFCTCKQVYKFYLEKKVFLF